MEKHLELVTQHDGYEYSALICATIFQLPQIISGYRSGTLRDMSAASQWLIFIGSSFWAVYMYENQLYHFLAGTVFVNVTSLLLLAMKLRYYYRRVNHLNDHLKSLDQDPSFAIMSKTSNQTAMNQV